MPTLREALSQSYNREDFTQYVLRRVFGTGKRLKVFTTEVPVRSLTAADRKLAASAAQYATVTLDDDTEVRCLEVRLHPQVRPEQSRVGIQALVRRLLTVGQAALVSFVPAEAEAAERPWRFSLVAKDAGLNEAGRVVEQASHARRYTYLLGPRQACRTPDERLSLLAGSASISLETLVKAFEVEVLSKEFFKEYKRHYEAFCDYLTESNFRQSVFNGDDKAIRDFVKKLLGRLVFLYFVQKKGWLGATTTAYTDGNRTFVFDLFQASGGDETFYPVWLSGLFFETLNQDATQNPRRAGDAFVLPDKQTVCIPFLNGGLFDRDRYDHARYQLTLLPTLFHQPHHHEEPKQRGFLDFLGAYNFTVQEDSPDEHVVAVDPEMLGNIFENLLEDNKDKGAFYTPKEIVHYMCRESLIEYLDTRLNVFEVPLGHAAGRGLQVPAQPGAAGQLALTTTENRGNIQRDELADFVREKHPNDFIRQHARQIDRLLDTVKICDPAIGSGAFPMGLLHEIYLCKLVLKDLTPAQEASLFHERDLAADPGSFHAQVKLAIIQNSIYGVDIERGAVDIARLRFWLSLVVDEDRPRPLPNLDYKIVEGNSLVSKLAGDTLTLNWNHRASTDREKQLRNQYEALGKLQSRFFTQTGTKKDELKTQIRDAKIDLLLAQVELELEKLPKPQLGLGGFGGSAKQQAADLAVLTKRQGYEAQARQLRTLRADATRALPYFDWRLDFPEVLNPHVTDAPGFDIVIGNPPYVRSEVLGGELKDQLKQLFPNVYLGTADLLVYFYELGLGLLRPSGELALITSNKFMKADYGRMLRERLRQFQIRRLTDFGELPVFATAATFPLVAQIQKSASVGTVRFTQVKQLNSGELLADVVQRIGQELNDAAFAGPNWSLTADVHTSILTKMRGCGHSLQKYTGGEIYRGILTGCNEAFKLTAVQRTELIRQDPRSAELIVPFAVGDDVRKYRIKGKGEGYLILTKIGVEIQKYPAILNHLKKFQAKLENRTDKGKFWWEFRSCGYYDAFEKPKLVYPDIAKESRMTLVTEPYYFGNTAYIMPVDDKYLLAVLNSRAVFYFFSKVASVLGDAEKGGRLRWFTQDVKNIPIPVASPTQRKLLIALVTQILAAKAALATADTAALEAEIDVLVYHLYGLSYPEVLLVEPGFALSEAAYAAAAGK